MKQCTQCKKKKEISEFIKDKYRKEGIGYRCKKCNAENAKSWYSSGGKEYRVKNKERIYKKQKEWLLKNKGRYEGRYKYNYLKYKENHRKWKIKNIKWVREQNRLWQKKQRTNPKFRIDNNMKSGIHNCLKGNKAGRKWETLVGYSLQDLIHHLEKQFNEKMSWQNYGNYWWIDHKTPKSWFKYENAEDKEFRKCWALENLQPLEKIANMSKCNYYATL